MCEYTTTQEISIMDMEIIEEHLNKLEEVFADIEGITVNYFRIYDNEMQIQLCFSADEDYDRGFAVLVNVFNILMEDKFNIYNDNGFTLSCSVVPNKEGVMPRFFITSVYETVYEACNKIDRLADSIKGIGA